MVIEQLDVPIDEQWHEYTLGPILHIDFKRQNFVTLWWDAGTAVEDRWTRWLRVYTTDQPIPKDAVYVGSALDQRGQGEIHHLHRTDYWGAHGEDPPPDSPDRERPHPWTPGLG